jgi:hypothetical protein
MPDDIDELGLFLAQPPPREIPDSLQIKNLLPLNRMLFLMGIAIVLVFPPFGLLLVYVLFAARKQIRQILQNGVFTLARVREVDPARSRVLLTIHNGEEEVEIESHLWFRSSRQLKIALHALQEKAETGILYLPDQPQKMVFAESLLETATPASDAPEEKESVPLSTFGE